MRLSPSVFTVNLTMFNSGYTRTVILMVEAPENQWNWLRQGFGDKERAKIYCY